MGDAEERNAKLLKTIWQVVLAFVAAGGLSLGGWAGLRGSDAKDYLEDVWRPRVEEESINLRIKCAALEEKVERLERDVERLIDARMGRAARAEKPAPARRGAVRDFRLPDIGAEQAAE